MKVEYIANLKKEDKLKLGEQAIIYIRGVLQEAFLSGKDVTQDFLKFILFNFEGKLTILQGGETNEKDLFNFDPQAIGAFMMVLQNVLVKHTNILEELRSLDFVVSDKKLIVINPPKLELRDVVEVLEEV